MPSLERWPGEIQNGGQSVMSGHPNMRLNRGRPVAVTHFPSVLEAPTFYKLSGIHYNRKTELTVVFQIFIQQKFCGKQFECAGTLKTTITVSQPNHSVKWLQCASSFTLCKSPINYSPLRPGRGSLWKHSQVNSSHSRAHIWTTQHPTRFHW